MVKTVLLSWTVAIASGDDSAGLVQLSTGVTHSQGQRILAAIAKEDSTICVEAAAGDVAPVAGSYIAKMDQQAIEVAVGEVAPQAGSFCASKQDVLLMQRTHGLHTARDFEAALGKKTTTTTTTAFANANFNENPDEVNMVKHCPADNFAPAAPLDAAAAAKQRQLDRMPWASGCASSPACRERIRIAQAKDRRVCLCRKFLKSTADKIGPMSSENILKLVAPDPPQLLQRNFDAALASKKQEETATTSTTSTTMTTTTILTSEEMDERMVIGCQTASQIPVNEFGAYGLFDQAPLPSWAMAAKLLNDPAITSTLFKKHNITEGWQHCDQSWVVHGACGKFLNATADKATANKTSADQA
jgi:hypothetical protein